MLADDANKLIDQLAEAFRGEVTLRMGPISPYPEMAFYHTRRRVFVDMVMRTDAERMTVTLPMEPEPGRRLFDVRLFGPRKMAWLLDFLRVRDPREMEADEPRGFRLWTAHPTRLRQHFSEAAAFRLGQLGAIDTRAELAVAWTPTRFLMQKPMRQFRLEPMQFAISQALKLIESLGDEGVLPFRPVGAEPEPIISTDGVVWDPVVGACRVCGDPLQNRVVYCGTCSTPHHPDCWEYTGQCSVYACGARQSSTRMVA